jgi:hypothetical protein
MKYFILLTLTGLTLASCGNNENAGEKAMTSADSSMTSTGTNSSGTTGGGTGDTATKGAISGNGTTPYNGSNAKGTTPNSDTTNTGDSDQR